MWKDYQHYLIQQLRLGKNYRGIKEKNGVVLESNLYEGPGILKARETIITVGETDIYNNIVYPKTGSNLPCLGMDFMTSVCASTGAPMCGSTIQICSTTFLSRL